MKPILPALVIILLCWEAYPAAIAASEQRITLESNLARDSDDARHDATYVKYRRYLANTEPATYWGAGLGDRSIDDANGHTQFNAVTIEFQIELSPIATYRLSGNKLLGNSWSPWTADTALILTPNDRSYTELFAERELVDTSLAIDKETVVSTYGISSDYRFTNELTLVGAAFRQNFSDGNVRNGRVVRVLFEISHVNWIIAELRRKQLKADFNGFGYFSPEKQIEDLALVTLSGTFFNDNLVANLQFGGGQQTINDDVRQSLYFIEFRSRGWLTQSTGFENTLGCKNTGDLSFGATNDDYRYCYAKLGLHYNW